MFEQRRHFADAKVTERYDDKVTIIEIYEPNLERKYFNLRLSNNLWLVIANNITLARMCRAVALPFDDSWTVAEIKTILEHLRDAKKEFFVEVKKHEWPDGYYLRGAYVTGRKIPEKSFWQKFWESIFK